MRRGLKIECTSVGPCVGERHTKMATKTKAETVVGGRLMEESSAEL